MAKSGSLWIRCLLPAGILLALLGTPETRAEPEVSLAERVAAQQAIEGVYRRHRTWPAENSTPRPPLSAVITDESIRAKVDEYLKMSRALEDRWGRPITSAQLQAEMDRIASKSAAPEILRDLFAVLNHDARLIAETLVRQTLAERFLRDSYAKDARFHGALRREAEQALARSSAAAEMPLMGGVYTERTFRLEESDEESRQTGTEGIGLERGKWDSLLSRLAESLGTPHGDLPVLELSPLQETATGFEVVAVLSRADDRITVGHVAWPKVPFDTWWDRVRVATGSGVDSAHGELTLPTIGAQGSFSGVGAGCEDATWTPMYPFNPSGGSFLGAAVWTGTEMIVWGGWNGAPMDSGARYDPVLDSWTPMTPGPSERTSHSMVWTGTEVIVWGGCADGCFGGDPVYAADGGRYDPVSDTWTAIPMDANTPTGRRYASAVWTGSEMIVWGGRGYDDDGRYLATGARYDPLADSWLPTAATGAPQGRNVHRAVWTGSEMIVWGGYNNDVTLLKTAGRYDPATDSWQSTAPSNIDNRYRHSAIWTGAEMIIWGGGSNAGTRYDPVADTWTPTSVTFQTPSDRANHAAVWTGTEMIVWGGVDTFSAETGGRYDPATDSWTLISVVGVPEGRGSLATVWTGTEMLVWGGFESQGGYYSDGGRYDPVGDSWTLIVPPATLPQARFDHSSVWTGAEMIVWGGDISFYLEPVNSGGLYNPATDSWLPTDTGASVPEARKEQAAVWTGLEMIVWGGSDRLGDLLGTGGRYNPATDSWAPTSVGPGAPAARKRHASVWTGTEMIVWGGCGSTCSGSTDTGARYDPVSDAWTVMPVGIDTPGRRQNMSAVWTGSEMIVWAGKAGVALQSGGRYDPIVGAWLPTALSGAPTARHGHTAVWADGKMIVWGGPIWDLTGGLYDPATDQWTATHLVGAPTSRRDHTAVWTGSEMVVWGGEGPDATSLHTGGRYDPANDSWMPVDRDVLSRARQHGAAWTGSEMLVWGGWNGYLAFSKGSRLCVCVDWYTDADGDGFGDPSASICAAGQPVDGVRIAGDCDDTDAATHAGASEVNDGLDNQCPDDDGFGLVDEVSGDSGFHDPEDRTAYSWTPQSGATSYEVARSTEPDFSMDCSSFLTTVAHLSDPEIPQPGESFNYLTRATAPSPGSWGASSEGVERSLICP